MFFGKARLRSRLEKYSDAELSNMVLCELSKPYKKINEKAVRMALQILREREVETPVPRCPK